MHEYCVGDVVGVLPPTELDQGLHEDAAPVKIDTPMKVKILAPFKDGAYEVSLVGSEEIQPLYWHQPVPRII